MKISVNDRNWCAVVAVATLLTLSTFISKTAAQQPRLIDVQEIWAEAPHNAFTDLARFRDQWFCAFREGAAHVSPDGALRVIKSADGKTWESAARITSADGDLRDAKLCVTPTGKLMLAGAVALAQPNKHKHRSLVWFSDDGTKWTEAQAIGDPDMWLWRVTWHNEKAYSVGYSTAGAHTTRLYVSDDGQQFETLVDTLFDQGYPNEHAMAFLPDGTALCLLRRDPAQAAEEGADARLAVLGTSQAPYTDWKWQTLDRQIGGPALLRLPDGRLVAGVRLYDAKVRTSLCWLDSAEGKLEEFITLPSAGDSSYPGLVWQDNQLWVSYYSSHEGKSKIYLARVEIPALTSE